MIAEVKDSNSSEITKVREDWDELTRKIHHLEAEIDASQALVRDMVVERNELRACLDEKQAAMRAEDEDFMKEIETLLAEFAARAKNENPDAPQKSGLELLKHFAEVTEKSAETLAKRAEVSILSLYETKRGLTWDDSISTNKVILSNHYRSKSSISRSPGVTKKMTASPNNARYVHFPILQIVFFESLTFLDRLNSKKSSTANPENWLSSCQPGTTSKAVYSTATSQLRGTVILLLQAAGNQRDGSRGREVSSLRRVLVDDEPAKRTKKSQACKKERRTLCKWFLSLDIF